MRIANSEWFCQAGLTDQPFARFSDRVARCTEAIQRANNQTGYHCLYVPNITAPADQVLTRAREAKRRGAGGVMIAPGLVGWDAIRLLAAVGAFPLANRIARILSLGQRHLWAHIHLSFPSLPAA